MSVDLAARCNALKSYGLAQPLPRPATATGSVTAAWARAGMRAGTVLGATFGGLLTLFGGLLPVARVGATLGGLLTVIGGLLPVTLIGALVGGVVGAVAGLVVGTLNGVVLGALSTTLLNPKAPDRRERAPVVAGATTGTAGLAFQMLLFGWLSGVGARVLLVYLPATAAALMAGRLSRRLPPVS